MSVLFIESSEKQFLEVLSGESPPASSHLEEVDCDLCGKNADSDDIPIVPDINGDKYRLEMISAGRFCCLETGIKFEVNRPVTLEYELDSWKNYMEYLPHGGFEVLGPLIKVTTPLPPNTVSAVYLPHYMCLKEFGGDKSWIRCAHFKDGNLSVETPTRILPFHVVLENPSFSSLGIFMFNLLPVALAKQKPIHGKVFLYFRTVGTEYLEYKIHLYLMPSFAPVKEVFHQEKFRNGFRKIDKPHKTKTVYIKRNYSVKGPGGAVISPKELQVDCISPLESYADITVRAEVKPINIQLVKEDNTQIWQSCLSEGELEELEQQFLQNTGSQVSGSEYETFEELELTSDVFDSEFDDSSEESDSESDDLYASSSIPKKHFVDEHREALINGVSLVAPILDSLMSADLLTYEERETVLNERTSFDQMRRLYYHARVWNDAQKDIFYEALKKHNRVLVDNLERPQP